MGASSATCLLFLLWLFAATLFLSFFVAESNVSCNEKDKQALLKFKRSLIFPPGYSQDDCFSWDCFGWNKVHCDKKTGRVTKLSVTSVGGEISPSLLELEFLNYLDLSSNNFNCTPIPSFLGSMGSLTHLELSEANFCGLIPPQLGNLSSLHYLDLGDNSDLYVDNLHWMSGLSAIQVLDLSSVDLHREVDWLQIMSKFPSLSELYLNYCQLDSLNPFLGFVNFTTLRVLELSGNHFNHEIPPSIFSLRKLRALYLDSNKLTGKIPESLGQLKHLTDLNLTNNSLSGPIPSSIGNLSHLVGLQLSENQFNGTIPKTLGLLSNLEELSIGNNILTGTVNERHFTKFSKLTDLDILIHICTLM